VVPSLALSQKAKIPAVIKTLSENTFPNDSSKKQIEYNARKPYEPRIE
jgi:hypothetical protein